MVSVRACVCTTALPCPALPCPALPCPALPAAVFTDNIVLLLLLLPLSAGYPVALNSTHLLQGGCKVTCASKVPYAPALKLMTGINSSIFFFSPTRFIMASPIPKVCGSSCFMVPMGTGHPWHGIRRID